MQGREPSHQPHEQLAWWSLHGDRQLVAGNSAETRCHVDDLPRGCGAYGSVAGGVYRKRGSVIGIPAHLRSNVLLQAAAGEGSHCSEGQGITRGRIARGRNADGNCRKRTSVDRDRRSSAEAARGSGDGSCAWWTGESACGSDDARTIHARDRGVGRGPICARRQIFRAAVIVVTGGG
jgi:hypothetical protein